MRIYSLKTLAACATLFAAVPVFAATTPNLLTNPGAETGDITGWTQGGDSNPGVDDGTFDSGINPHTGSFDFYGVRGALGTLTQSITLASIAGIDFNDIDAGAVHGTVSFWQQGLNQGQPSDSGSVTLLFRNAVSNVIGTISTPTIDSHNGAWQNSTTLFDLPTGARSIEYTMNFIRNVGTDNDAFIDDNSLILSTSSAPAAIPLPPAVWMGLATLAGLGLLSSRKRRISMT